jgi:hypothetical protein
MFVKPIKGTRFRTHFDEMDPVTADIMRDPLDYEEIDRLAEIAEEPELADFWLMSLPGTELSERQEVLIEKVRFGLHSPRESPEEFLHRIRGRH